MTRTAVPVGTTIKATRSILSPMYDSTMVGTVKTAELAQQVADLGRAAYGVTLYYNTAAKAQGSGEYLWEVWITGRYTQRQRTICEGFVTGMAMGAALGK